MKYAIVHVADIHYRPNEPEGVSTVLQAFVRDLQNQRNIVAADRYYIAITGDLVFSGSDSQAYSALYEEFDEALSKVGFAKDVRVVVPGNHDMDQLTVKHDSDGFQKELTTRKNNERDLNDFISTHSHKDTRFSNYHNFESRFAKFGTACSVLGQGWKLADDLGVFCLNTALCSSAGSNSYPDEGELAIGTRCLTEWCNSTTTSTNILLMHHPTDHLNTWSSKELQRLIEQHFSLCLCGHRHTQNIYHDRISQKTLIVSAPQLFTSKDDTLGYGIVLLEDGRVDEISYRQYVDGAFLAGSHFSRNDTGVVSIPSAVRTDTKRLERALTTALSSYKGQPEIFIKPAVTKDRESDDGENLLSELIVNPTSSLVLAQPQFGQTCLCHYMRLKAYKRGSLWAYIDANHTKTRKVLDVIQEQLDFFGVTTTHPDCILLDSWNGSIIDHANMLKCLDSEFPETPILVMVNYTEPTFSENFSLSKLQHKFEMVHLQPLSQTRVRELIAKYGEAKKLPSNDAVVTKVVRDLAALNVHRTPLNCLTLLRVFEKDQNEEIINRTKLIKTVLFILFTDTESFTYASSKPDVDDCEFILGKFCKSLIERATRTFTRQDLLESLRAYCQEKLISVDVEVVIDILESNKILLRFRDTLEFKHSYWIFYFAATYMLHDSEFAEQILSNRNYVNYPEIIEFYTGCDGRRADAVETLVADIEALVASVDGKIGILEEFNPYEQAVWNPTDKAIEAMQIEVLKKVEESNLPTEIKDRYADQTYDFGAAYDQSINQILHEYSVLSLMQTIKATSRALRNSKYIDPELKRRMLSCIIKGWASMSRVFVLLAQTLAQKGHANYDGFGLILSKGFDGSHQEKLKGILLAGPFNVVHYLKDDLSSGKIGPLVYSLLTSDIDNIQKHFLAHFLVRERPEGWYKPVYEYMNLLHRNSFYLWDLSNALNSELALGFTTRNEQDHLKDLTEIVVAKHVGGSRKRALNMKNLALGQAISTRNKLPIDKIRAAARRKSPNIQKNSPRSWS